MNNYVCLACGQRYAEHRSPCGSCWEPGLVVDIGSRAVAESDSIPEHTSARELARLTWQKLQSTRYPDSTLGRGAFVVLVGQPSAGKSTLLSGLLDGIAGPVVLLSHEEPIGPTLAGRLQRVGVKRDDFHIVSRATVDQLVELLQETKATALGIDSLQPAMLTGRDCRHLLTVVPMLHVVFATAQVNKEGQIAGVKSVEHETDVVLQVEALRWTVTKSRYQPNGASGAVAVAPSLPTREDAA